MSDKDCEQAKIALSRDALAPQVSVRAPALDDGDGGMHVAGYGQCAPENPRVVQRTIADDSEVLQAFARLLRHWYVADQGEHGPPCEC